MTSTQADYFTFLGLPRRLRLDPADLDQRYRTLSRQYHPDYFYRATAAERRASLERSSYLNDAYRTLRHPVTRLEYLLRLEGEVPSGAQAGTQVPAALLEEVFALNEELDAIRDLRSSGAPADVVRARLVEARRPIEAKRAAHEADLHGLAARWDALAEAGASERERQAVLAALRERLIEHNYIRNLLAGIERELAQ